nr:FAD-dependent oxidoreductase [Rhizobium sp. AN95]
MVELGGSTGHAKTTDPKGHGSYVCFYDRQIYKWAALQMVQEAGADILFHSFLSDVQVENGRVVSITTTSKSGRTAYRAQVFVDATGDGDLAALAGAEYSVGRADGVVQPATLMFEMAQVDTAAVKKYMDENPDDFWRRSEIVPMRTFSTDLEQKHYCGQGFIRAVREATDSGDLKLGRDSVLFWTGVRPGVLHFNSTRVSAVNAISADDLTRAEIEGREQTDVLGRFSSPQSTRV